jgi:TrmH family RNA methyltransferase
MPAHNTTTTSGRQAGSSAAGAGHPRVRQYLAVKHRRGHQPPGAVTLEGLWAIRAAVASGADVDVVFICDELVRGDASYRLVDQLVATQRTRAFRVSERVLRRMVDRDGPDGFAALAHVPRPGLADLATTLGDDTRVVVADGFELPGNLGTIVRCADGAGAAAVLVTDGRVRVTHPLVVKASMGTVFTTPTVAVDRADAHAWLRAHGFRVVAADPEAPTSYRQADYTGRVAIVLGSERYGLAPFWRKHAELAVSIPMLGVADSLNVGHAAALLLYEALHAVRSNATTQTSSARSASATHSSSTNVRQRSDAPPAVGSADNSRASPSSSASPRRSTSPSV